MPTTEDAKAHLSFLATRRRVSASTRNQAFSELLLLYRNVFLTDLGDMAATLRVRRGASSKRSPGISSVRALFASFYSESVSVAPRRVVGLW